MPNRPASYLSPKLAAASAPDKGALGVFAQQTVYPGELLAVWGGRILSEQQFALQDQRLRRYAHQMEDGLFLAPLGAPEAADEINHRCDPNAGLRGQLALVALRTIEPGEEIGYDYAACQAHPAFEFACRCGAENCRRFISARDWQNPALWERCAGHFSPYLQHRLDLLRAGNPPIERRAPEPDGQEPAPALAAHYLSPKLSAGQNLNKGQHGVYALQPISAGELLTVWGGVIVPYAALAELEPYQREQAIQVEEGLHQAPFGASEPADYFNHSCNPNAGLDGQNCLAAMRDIAAGEEVCFDYATSDSTPYDEFACGCGESSCRGWISAQDWRRPDLWQRYAGYFSPYLQARIDRLRSAG